MPISPENQRIAAGGTICSTTAAAALERRPALGLAHRGLDREVAGAAAHFRLDEPRMRFAIAVDAGVDDPELHALKAREHVDGGAAVRGSS